MNIVWLRRDLRLHDHAALHLALDENAPIQPIFVFDTDILSRFENPKDHRLSFIADALYTIDAELRARGGRLWVFHGRAVEILPKLAKELSARIFAAEDFEPDTIARDKAVAAKAPLTLTLDHLLAHPAAITKDDGSAYKVFTPYSKAWYAALDEGWYADRRIHDKGRYANAKPPLPVLDTSSPQTLLAQIGYEYAPLAMWPVTDGQKRLRHFEKSILGHYAETRDIPGTDGTSKLSPYLRFGLVSIRECYRAVTARLASRASHQPAKQRSIGEQAGEPGNSAKKWINELIWRDFYAMILYRFPESATQEFQPQYRDLKWSYDKKHIHAWKEGRTGYPIVDAAMRQLLTEGWMHNRTRMVVASFLTKHLQIDWRIGEEHFAQHLMDYELTSNVGGWQWAASTGTDAQPYFRVFNPYLQSKKFDGEGNYIRKYVPELADLANDAIHDPSPLLLPGSYPPPVVDHAAARKSAIALFKKHSSG